MKEIKKFLKTYLGELATIIGTGLFAYNVFDFSYITSVKGDSRYLFGNPSTPETGVAYYYSSDALIWITIGALLIVAGILIIKNKRYEKKD